jgi:hypothetical protein
MSNYQKTIAIDFDGVIHRYSKGWHDGTIYDEPMEGALEAIHRLMGNYAVFIHTTRDPRAVVEWFSKQHFPFLVNAIPEDTKFWGQKFVLGVTNRKLPAIAYIDDRGLRFTNWRDMLNYF